MRKAAAGLAVVLAVLSAGVLASACGGGAPPGVASLSGHSDTTTTSSTGSGTAGTTTGSGTKQHAAIAYSKCMRSHGVKNFPDPGSGSTNGAIRISQGSGLDPNSPTFQAAQNVCQSLLPKPSAAQIEKMKKNALAYSKCMRAHGVTNFPDPTFSTTGGGIAVKIGGGPNSGLDPNSPTFKKAQQACQSILHLANGGKGAKSQQTAGG
jgi:hypothetical protein